MKLASRLFAAAAAGAVLGCSPADDSAGPRVRVVLITLDTLRLDSLLGAGSTSSMPSTLARAREGLVFERHYSASSTTMPAHASMLTGLHPWEHGATANGMVLDPAVDTVAEHFRRAGFETAAVVASFPLHGKFGFEQGFDVYHNEFGEEVESAVVRDGDFSTADRINRRAFDVLDELGGRKQFVWFHYFDAHSPYGYTENPGSNYYPRVLAKRIHSVPDERDFILSRSRELYDVDVGFLDRALGALLDRLQAESDDWETHVVVVSDHGEAFGEGGAFGHGQRLVDVQIRVPLFVLSPAVEPGVRSEPVGSVDVGATLLALGGLEVDLPAGEDVTGSLEPGRRVLGMRRTFEEPSEEFRVDGTTRALDEHQFFLVRGSEVFVGNADRLMLGDTERPAASGARARSVMEAFAGYAQALADRPPPELDAESLKALERLGYTR